MPQIRKHPDWGKRYLWKNFLWSIPFLVLFPLLWWLFAKEELRTLTSVLFIGLFLYVLIAARSQLRREWRCNCPECGDKIVGHIGGYDLGPGDPLRFYCPKCDIVWDTGARISD